jgi:hypothetical protein
LVTQYIIFSVLGHPKVVSLAFACKQSIINGFQHEQPDYWLTFGNPWEIERPVVGYPINFYGHGEF